MKPMKRTIKASLAYCGHNVLWLAEQLGRSKGYIYERFKDNAWTYPELDRMRELFKWETLDGNA